MPVEGNRASLYRKPLLKTLSNVHVRQVWLVFCAENLWSWFIYWGIKLGGVVTPPHFFSCSEVMCKGHRGPMKLILVSFCSLECFLSDHGTIVSNHWDPYGNGVLDPWKSMVNGRAGCGRVSCWSISRWILKSQSCVNFLLLREGAFINWFLFAVVGVSVVLGPSL